MRYFAGMFDAEGYVSLLKTGNFLIGMEMANEEIPNLFKETFGGTIYTRKRDNRKKTFTWNIGTNRDLAVNFINLVFPFCFVKDAQLRLLKSHISSTREQKRKERDEIRRLLSGLKQPTPASKNFFDTGELKVVPETDFYEWFAGFIDGDGNFTLYESKKERWIGFQSWFGVFNIHPEPICYVRENLKGTIGTYHHSKNIIWKWVCSQSIEQSVCQSLLPFLRIKKRAAEIIIEYHEIKKTKNRFVSYSLEDRDKIRDLINQLKHINSL